MLKKYPNRRLFDTGKKPNGAGQYTTLTKIRDRLAAGEIVTMHPGGEDITAEALWGLVLEDIRNDRGPSAEQLRAFIRTYTNPVRG